MRPRSVLAALPCAIAALASTPTVESSPSLQQYRYFRSLSIDLNGRMPTRDEISQFEMAPDPNAYLDTYVDAHTSGATYAERIRRIYEDLTRLEIGSTFQYVPSMTVLHRVQILGPTGQPMYVYFRHGQRRPHTDATRMDTDGDFCLTPDETGQQYPTNTDPTPYMGGPHAVSQTVLDTYTVVVKPWWLYRDYRSSSPTQLYSSAWATMFPGLQPAAGLLTEPDGTTPTTSIRICREEAATAGTGHIYASTRTSTTATPPRIINFPYDSTYAKSNQGMSISCYSGTAYSMTTDCGCGVGLERCMPGASSGFDPHAFAFPYQTPIGFDQPMDQVEQDQSAWLRFWWGQEAVHFLDDIFANDYDFRDLLTSHATLVNGPLVQFYRSSAPSTCCGNGPSFGYTVPDPLLDPANLPTDLLPHDTAHWERVTDRGPHASGLLTMPVFLTKFGSRRGRAHVLYNAFLCRDFVAGNVQLLPSTEPNLMVRPGCNTCHATLEPLAAYFSRVIESDWTFLPAQQFPLQSPMCAQSDAGTIHGYCSTFYDPAFTDNSNGTLRGAYPDLPGVAGINSTSPGYGMTRSDLGPAGLASLLISDPGFAPQFEQCVVTNIAGSFLGRTLTAEDAALISQLVTALMSPPQAEPGASNPPAGGMSVRSLVRALVRSDAYRLGNNEAYAGDGGTQ